MWITTRAMESSWTGYHSEVVLHLTSPHCDSIVHFTFVYAFHSWKWHCVSTWVHFRKGFICMCVCVYVLMCLLGYMQGTAGITLGGPEEGLEFHGGKVPRLWAIWHCARNWTQVLRTAPNWRTSPFPPCFHCLICCLYFTIYDLLNFFLILSDIS